RQSHFDQHRPLRRDFDTVNEPKVVDVDRNLRIVHRLERLDGTGSQILNVDFFHRFTPSRPVVLRSAAPREACAMRASRTSPASDIRARPKTRPACPDQPQRGALLSIRREISGTYFPLLPVSCPSSLPS